MKSSVKMAIVASLLLAAALAMGLFFMQPAVVQLPVTSNDPVQAHSTQTDPTPAGSLQTEGGVPTPEFVTEPVSEAATEVIGAAELAAQQLAAEKITDPHQHDEAMEKPSPEIINAIRDMKKPTPNEGQVTESPDGSAKIELGNRFRSVPVATVGKDGKVHVDYHGEKYLEEQKLDEQKQKEVPQP